MRIFKIASLIIAGTLFLSGCLNYDQNTIVKADGSGEMYLHCWIKVTEQYDSASLTKFALFNKDSLGNIFTSRFTEVEKIYVYKMNQDSVFHSKVHLSFTHFDSLGLVRGFKNFNFSFSRGPGNTIIFSHVINPFPSVFGIGRGDEEISYTYSLPGEIVKHNATGQKKNNLYWKFKSSDVERFQTLTATYRPFKLEETPKWIYYIALSVLLIVTIFLLRSKRR
ncbi:MAG: hypothetical protein GXX85_02350 [Ignavibacteria bacterium]|nr:hypothetical protein [Ignavibacteria bacterium]